MSNIRNQQVYIIKLKSGKYYVGISFDPWRRWLQHIKGTGALVCRYDPPTARIWIADTGSAAEWVAKLIEDYITVFWMTIHGSKNVIGGNYTDKQYREASREWCSIELKRIKDILSRSCYKEAGILNIDQVPINEYSALFKAL